MSVVFDSCIAFHLLSTEDYGSGLVYVLYKGNKKRRVMGSK